MRSGRDDDDTSKSNITGKLFWGAIFNTFSAVNGAAKWVA